MCIIGREAEKATRDIKVFKVLLKNGSTIFRNERGYEIRNIAIGDFTEDFDTVVQNRAIGFDQGFGFSVFDDKINANHYIKDVTLEFCKVRLQIKEYKIPKGSLYVRGEIEHGCVGEGLSAIRCKELKQIARRTKCQ